MRRSSPRAAALLLASLFGAASVGYIVWSDGLVAAFTKDPARITAIQTYKGWAYVGVATALVYALLRVAQRHRGAAEDAYRLNEERVKANLEEMVRERTLDLEAAQDRTRLILESTGDGLMGLDREGFITFVNLAGSRIVGHAPASLIGQHLHRALHGRCPDDECPLERALREGRGDRDDQRTWVSADGRDIPVEYAFEPMRRGDELVGGVVVFSDISARRATEAARAAALSEAERLARVKSEFLANMSHEIRTPLNAVLGLAQAGLRGGRGDRATFGHILSSGRHLLSLVNDVLDFSKIEAGKLPLDNAPFLLGEAIDRALEIVAGSAFGKGISLDVDEEAGLPRECHGDALRLSQVLVNLLGNAIKFTERGGRVSLSVTVANGMLSFRVSDTGIGMSKAQVARLFQPFEQADGSTTRRWGGTGLGLSISKRLVEMMNGAIDVESALGEGSTFTLRVPLVGAAPAPPRAASVVALALAPDEASRLSAALASRSITIVDRDADPAAPLVVAIESLADAAARRAIDERIAKGVPAALVVTPGATEIPSALRGHVSTLERPARARHVIDLLDGRLPREAPGGAIEPRLLGLSILAAEDNEANRVVLEAMLEREGAKLVCVEDGRRALAMLEERGARAFDVLLTDVQMPVMDGYETARRVREAAPSLPVIGLTAHAAPEERARCLAAGMIERLVKPLDLDELVATLQRHARGRSAAVAPPEPAEVVIDWAALEDTFSDDLPVIDKLAATALRTHAGDAASLRALVESADVEAMAALAHKIKGMSGNLRAPAVLALAREVEDAARAMDPRALHLAPRLASAVDAMMRELAARVATKPA